MNRIQKLKQLAFEKKHFDALLITNEYNLQYLTGTPGATFLLIPKKSENQLYSYGVNYEQTKAEAKNLNVQFIKRNEKMTDKIAPQIKTHNIKKLAIDTLNHDTYRQLAKTLRGKTKIQTQTNLLWQLRKIKDPDEQNLMRKAGQITVAGMKAAQETIRPGITEIDVAAEIEHTMRKKGGYGTAFETIVASGTRSAYPHGGCAQRQIHQGDLVVVDIGSKLEHYCSDMTRTFTAGKPTEKQTKLYNIVKNAQEKAYHAIKHKTNAKDVDHAARKIIEATGYGDNFNHGLGHGVGLEIHEPPILGPNSKDKLVAGNVVTNEPGIYFTDYGGFRIEDTVLIRKRTTEKLTDGFYTLETAK